MTMYIRSDALDINDWTRTTRAGMKRLKATIRQAIGFSDDTSDYPVEMLQSNAAPAAGAVGVVRYLNRRTNRWIGQNVSRSQINRRRAVQRQPA